MINCKGQEFKKQTETKTPKAHNDMTKKFPDSGTPRCTESQVVDQVKLSLKHLSLESLSLWSTYVLFITTMDWFWKPRRIIHTLNGKAQKENTYRDTTQIQLEFQMPKILAPKNNLVSFLFFFFIRYSSLFSVWRNQVVMWNQHWNPQAEAEHQKQNFKYWVSLWFDLHFWSNKGWNQGRQTTEWTKTN